MVVFWKENLRRQLQLITLENEGGDDTNYPSPPNVTFFDDPEVPFGPQGPQPRAPPEPHQPPGPPGPTGIPSGWPPAPSPAGGWERVETGYTVRERLHLHLRPSPPEPQNVPIQMRDGEYDDDEPPQGERHRQRSRSRERVYPHVPVPQGTTNSTYGDSRIRWWDIRWGFYNCWFFTTVSWTRRIAPEDTKDLDHVSEYIHVHPHMLVDNNSLLYLFLYEYSRIWQLRLKTKIQQPWIHRIVWVIIQCQHKIKKTHGDRVHKHRRERKILQKISRVHRKRPRSISPCIQMKTMKSLKMSLELLQILKLLYQYYLFTKDQQPVSSQRPAASTQGPAASANSGDVQRWVQCTESRLWNNSTVSRSPRSSRWWTLDTDAWNTQLCRKSRIILFR